jgi:hypothetical protein
LYHLSFGYLYHSGDHINWFLLYVEGVYNKRYGHYQDANFALMLMELTIESDVDWKEWGERVWVSNPCNYLHASTNQVTIL